jgi:hypothetical protein
VQAMNFQARKSTLQNCNPIAVRGAAWLNSCAPGGKSWHYNKIGSNLRVNCRGSQAPVRGKMTYSYPRRRESIAMQQLPAHSL